MPSKQDEIMSVINNLIDKQSVEKQEQIARLKAAAVEAKANPKPDIFGRKPRKFPEGVFDIEKDFGITIELAQRAEDCVIRTPNGEILHLVANMSIDYVGDDLIPKATLTFLNPKIVAKKQEPDIKDNFLLQQILADRGLERMYDDIINHSSQKVIIAPEYKDTGALAD